MAGGSYLGAARAVPIACVLVLLGVGLWKPVELERQPRATSGHGARAQRHDVHLADRRTHERRPTAELGAYRDLGSWIDIYNRWPWRHPTLAVRKLHHHHVRTLFLQTSNYGADVDLFRPRAIRRFLAAAHKRDMAVVAWYVPSFKHLRKDVRRVKAQYHFGRAHHGFDSLALDIESTRVGNVWRRNRALLDLSRRVRSLVGRSYPLGAITPDPVVSDYWQPFPYQRVARLYDVFVPMGYFSFRSDGYRDAKDYTARGIRKIRHEAGTDVAIHMIGGIGGDTGQPEVKGFVRAVRGHKAIGGSYYDFSATTDREWKGLRPLARAQHRPRPTPKP
ncbi:MAG TPA: hypothetical protein VFK89_04635 [Actinomycetota bacterium]|nr:hypothetical protein [Actinomycetota bacterium]